MTPQARAEALADLAQQTGTNTAAAANTPATSAPNLTAVTGPQQQIPGHGLDALAYAALNDGHGHGQAHGQAHYVPDHATMVGDDGDDYGDPDQDQDERGEDV